MDVRSGASGAVTAGSPLTVAVVGTGLIGGSLALALRGAGMRVQGYDADPERLARALDRGAIDVAAPSLVDAYAGADAAFVAVTVSAVAGAVAAALNAGVGAVSDVGSVKGPVVRAVEGRAGRASSRFVGGHPMAGSAGEEGIEGADADLFLGAAWVLTPTAETDPAAFTVVRDLVSLTGAKVIAVDPELHDELVAIVSHLPMLAASAVMHLAADDDDHDTLLRLAAGSFRALTRVSGRSAGIWPDICVENQAAILHILDRYMKELERVRELVVAAEREPLLDFFEIARAEVSNLPERSAGAGPLVELTMPVPDRPGVLAEVTTLAGRRGVNIVDLDISHGPDGGALLMVVPAEGADAIVAGLEDLGYHPTRRELA